MGGVGFGPCPRHEFVDARGGPEIDEPVEDVGDIGLRFDIVELASFNQRSDAGPVSAPSSWPAKSAFLRLSTIVGLFCPYRAGRRDSLPMACASRATSSALL